jgi:hypothetical protein
MSSPLSLPKPHLADRCFSRDIPISGRDQFEADLAEWMSECVTSRTVNPETHRPWHREKELVQSADGIDEILDYVVQGPVPMALGDGPPKYRVYADYDWGRLNNGQWFVRGVGFHIIGLLNYKKHWVEPPDPPPPKIRNLVFKEEDRNVQNFADDIKDGDKLVHGVMQTAYNEARQASSLPENPIETPGAKDMFDTAKDIVKGGEVPLFDMAKMTVGLMLDVAISSQVPKVVKARRYAYAFFVAGFLSVITLEDLGEPGPGDALGKKFYDLGRKTAYNYNEKERYQIQLSLLHSYSCQPHRQGQFVAGCANWTFPDDYVRYWDPRILAIGLNNKFYMGEYSYK